MDDVRPTYVQRRPGPRGGVRFVTGGHPLAVDVPPAATAVCSTHAAACAGKDLFLWALDRPHDRTTVKAHGKTVTALCFVNLGGHLYLVTASSEVIYVWHVRTTMRAVTDGLELEPRVLGEKFGKVGHIHAITTAHDCLVSICVESSVLVYDFKSGSCMAVLEGHTGCVVAAKFLSSNAHRVLSVGEDRTIKLWDLVENKMLYQTAMMNAAPLSVDVHPGEARFSVGTSTGQVHVYRVEDSGACRRLQVLDITRLLGQHAAAMEEEARPRKPVVISSEPAWKVGVSALDEPDDSAPPVTDHSAGILAVKYQLVKGNAGAPAPITAVGGVIVAAPPAPEPEVDTVLVLSTAHCVLQIDAKTYDCITLADLTDPRAGALNTGVAGHYAFSPEPMETVCLLSSAFESSLRVFEVVPTDQSDPPPGLAAGPGSADKYNDKEKVLSEDQEPISMFPTKPVAEKSPLKADFIVKKAAGGPGSTSQAGGAAGARPKSMAGRVQDKPVTFHTKIKSSGYGSEAPFSIAKGKGKATNRPKTTGAGGAGGAGGRLGKEYPSQCEPPIQFQAKNKLEGGIGGSGAAHSGPILALEFSGDGTKLATCSSDRTARVMRLPLSRHNGEGADLHGHNGVVSAVGWSHDAGMVLTASGDNTARLWTSRGDSLLTFDKINHSLKEEKPSPSFTSEVRGASLYYLDKFILLSSGSKLYMYKYLIDKEKKDDIARYSNRNKYKLVCDITQGGAQNITSFSSVNAFLSNLVVAAGSDRSIDIMDMSIGKRVRTIKDSHSRPVHTVRVNGGSAYATNPPDSYQLFLTAATDNCIKLWDIRTQQCVQRYSGHMNHSHSIGVDFSPCMRYIASGSEDKCAYLFDQRRAGGGGYLHRLQGHTDVVSSVAFNPLHPQFATASHDGYVRFYSDAA